MWHGTYDPVVSSEQPRQEKKMVCKKFAAPAPAQQLVFFLSLKEGEGMGYF